MDEAPKPADSTTSALRTAGLPAESVEEWLSAEPDSPTEEGSRLRPIRALLRGILA